MAYDVVEIDSYGCSIYSPRSTLWRAFIPVYKDDVLVAQLLFYDDESIMPARNQVIPGGVFNIYYPMDRFNDIINILRYEKPLKIAFNAENRNAYLGTLEKEPIGEEESRKYILRR